MMKKFFSMASKLCLLLAPIALTTAIASNGIMCVMWAYQPQAPESLQKLGK
ncbi:MAG TPA: cyclic lactone autoinducer peptide [Oscillospiraceae bacterium]|nr:cyclic lactone autoinducer peptide [Oscillospiraceae bacterium]HPF55266.1 cyclic lactone autoinducer peptide [Clostridiales bacterium]HPK36008.1 cyclic lactone autoinducer peptide [Oscillospiraceae bacterium]